MSCHAVAIIHFLITVSVIKEHFLVKSNSRRVLQYLIETPHFNKFVLHRIEILFSSQGNIKKVKIYLNPDGSKKGDALVTYSRAEAAALACIQVWGYL